MVGRLSWDEYFFQVAEKVATRSSCRRYRYGAVIVRDRDILTTGYNGTPMGTAHCDEGACPRCSQDVAHGTSYDECICVHSEENAILRAARTGISLIGATVYITGRPCLRCVMMAIQVGIAKIVCLEDKKPLPVNQERLKEKLCEQSGLKVEVKEYRVIVEESSD